MISFVKKVVAKNGQFYEVQEQGYKECHHAIRLLHDANLDSVANALSFI
jgi:hypothetical protein